MLCGKFVAGYGANSQVQGQRRLWCGGGVIGYVCAEIVGECGGWFAFIRTWGERPFQSSLAERFCFQYKNKIKAMRSVEHCVSACLVWQCGLCAFVDRKCALGECVRSERVAIRRKGGRMVCGVWIGDWFVWVCAEVAGVWGCERSSHGFSSVARASDPSPLCESGGCGWNVSLGWLSFKNKSFRFIFVCWFIKVPWLETDAERKRTKASIQAVRASLPFWGVFGGCGSLSVMCGWTESGCAGTGYEVGGWGERPFPSSLAERFCSCCINL